MSELVAMTTVEARERIDRVRALVNAAWDDLIALYQQRAWESLGYANWDDMCAAEFQGARIALPRDDRREIVGQLRDEGMSTRAIGSALGVGEATVRRDISGASDDAPEPKPVTGLDGKTYTRKPVTHIHLDPEDDVPDDEVASVEADLQSYIDGSADIRAANLRAGFSKWLHAMSQSHLYDPEEIAVIYPDRVADMRFIADQVSKWAATYEAEASQPLRVIKGNVR